MLKGNGMQILVGFISLKKNRLHFLRHKSGHTYMEKNKYIIIPYMVVFCTFSAIS